MINNMLSNSIQFILKSAPPAPPDSVNNLHKDAQTFHIAYLHPFTLATWQEYYECLFFFLVAIDMHQTQVCQVIMGRCIQVVGRPVPSTILRVRSSVGALVKKMIMARMSIMMAK